MSRRWDINLIVLFVDECCGALDLNVALSLTLNDVNNDFVFQYLIDKKMLGGNFRSGGRYRGICTV